MKRLKTPEKAIERWHYLCPTVSEVPDQHEGVLAVVVVAGNGVAVFEPELLVQRARGVVRPAHFEFDRRGALAGERPERRPEELLADAGAATLGGDGDVLDVADGLAVVRDGVGDDVTDDAAVVADRRRLAGALVGRLRDQKARVVEEPLERRERPRLGERLLDRKSVV